MPPPLPASPFARLPAGCLPPMLATLGSAPADAAAWAYEIKWDGYRALARWDGRKLTMCSRTGRDLLPAFPELAELPRGLRGPMLLDGEIVAVDQRGLSGFSALQTRMPTPRGRASSRSWDPARWRIAYVVFDLLHHRGRSLLGLPWHERRSRLERMALNGPSWSCPPAHDDRENLLAAARLRGEEGIIAKRRDSVYEPGRRSRDWIKIKLLQHEEFIVGGYWLGGADATLGSLLLGFHPSDAPTALRYAGKVGTGFDQTERRMLRERLDRFSCLASPFDKPIDGRDVRWCSPRLVVEIAYAQWTHDGILRHARYQGLRADKPARMVVRPDPLAPGGSA